MEPVSNLGKFGRALMIIVGIACLVFGIVLTATQYLPDDSVECTAVITGFETDKHDNSNIIYTSTIVSFELGNKKYDNIVLGQYESSWNVGDTMTIYCDPDEPTNIKTKTMTYGGWLLILFSLPFIIIGIYMTMSIRRRASKTPEEIAEDEERTTAGKLKYKVSSIVIPLSAGIPITAMGIVFLILEHNSALGVLSLVLGGISIYAGLRSVVVYFIIKYRHHRDAKKEIDS